MSNFHEISGPSELRKLRDHAGSVTKLGGVVAEFIKRKAALQERYANDLKSLVETMEQRSDPANLQGLAGYEHHNLINLWTHCRKVAQGEAALFEETAADNKDASAGLSATLNTQKKFLKMTFQDCNDLATAVANLEAACEKARAANVNTHTSPPPPSGGIMGQVFTSLSKMKDRTTSGKSQEGVSPGPQAHNKYLLQLVACNVQRRKYFEADLPEVLDATQDVYSVVVDQTSMAVNRVAAKWQSTTVALGELHSGLMARSGPATTGRVAVATAVDVISPSGAPPPEVVYISPTTGDPAPIASVSFDVSDRAAMQSLARTRSSLEITLKGHTADLTKQMKQVNGIEKLYENYQANPQFGSADSVYAELYENRRKLRNLQTLIQRNQAVISALSQSGVDAVSGPQGVPSPDGTILREPPVAGRPAVHSMYGGEEEEWEDDADADGETDGTPSAASRTFGARGTFVVARFDYAAESAEELTFSIGDVIEVTSGLDANGWMGGKLGGVNGMFPASYCTSFKGNWEDLGLTLYDYEASKPDELSITADEVLVVQSTTDDGWAEVLREDSGAIGLIPLSYIDRGFAKDPTKAKPISKTTSKSNVAEALIGAFDDLDLDSDDEPLPNSPAMSERGSFSSNRASRASLANVAESSPLRTSTSQGPAGASGKAASALATGKPRAPPQSAKPKTPSPATPTISPGSPKPSPKGPKPNVPVGSKPGSVPGSPRTARTAKIETTARPVAVGGSPKHSPRNSPKPGRAGGRDSPSAAPRSPQSMRRQKPQADAASGSNLAGEGASNPKGQPSDPSLKRSSFI